MTNGHANVRTPKQEARWKARSGYGKAVDGITVMSGKNRGAAREAGPTESCGDG